MHKVEQEYTTMSRRPGIAKWWFDKYKGDLYPKDYCTINAIKQKPARYYDKIYDVLCPEEMAKIKKKRMDMAQISADNTNERLKVRETVAALRLKDAERSIERTNQ